MIFQDGHLFISSFPKSSGHTSRWLSASDVTWIEKCLSVLLSDGGLTHHWLSLVCETRDCDWINREWTCTDWGWFKHNYQLRSGEYMAILLVKKASGWLDAWIVWICVFKWTDLPRVLAESSTCFKCELSRMDHRENLWTQRLYEVTSQPCRSSSKLAAVPPAGQFNSQHKLGLRDRDGGCLESETKLDLVSLRRAREWTHHASPAIPPLAARPRHYKTQVLFLLFFRAAADVMNDLTVAFMLLCIEIGCWDVKSTRNKMHNFCDLRRFNRSDRRRRFSTWWEYTSKHCCLWGGGYYFWNNVCNPFKGQVRSTWLSGPRF